MKDGFTLKMRNWLGLAMVLGLSASGCIAGAGDGTEDEHVESTQDALTNDGIYVGNYSGNTYRYSTGIAFTEVQSYHIFNAMRDDSTWPTSSPKAYSVIDWADWENYGEDMSRYGSPGPGLCGDTARQHYGAASGAKWCTEYARWVLRKAGLKNIRYCKTSFIGCLDYGYLSEARTVNDMVQLFSANGGWIHRASLKPEHFKPGNYLALTSHDIHKNHSAIIMSVSSDQRWLYTSEGNVTGDDGRDCVYFMRRDLYVNGALNTDIDGVGDISVAF